jgi:UDP-N-acetylmuramyl tripeptide synthase
LRTRVAVLAGRTVAFAIRVTRLGRATNLPGKVALALAPDLISALTTRFPSGVVLVSGTNGKTTTTAMISAVLSREMVVCTNAGGANLVAGVATALVQAPSDAQIGVFEVDEAALPLIARQHQPRVLVLLNLFRDQLDRHGELQSLAKKWRTMLGAFVEGETSLILNADDLLVASLRSDAIFFGLDDSGVGTGVLVDSADSTFCETCKNRLGFATVYMAHLGDWRCEACATGRPKLDVAGADVELMGLAGSSCRVQVESESQRLWLGLPGLYNLYNALAALAASRSVGIPLADSIQALETFAAAFGRFEQIQISGKGGYLILMKNPVGANEILRTISQDLSGAVLVLVLNDAIADGRDVSWIWDVDFEGVVIKCATVICSGTRANEMAVRMQYADVSPESILEIADPMTAVRRAAALTTTGPFFVLPTYTAMFELSGHFLAVSK